jgi:sialic acid synthase SpsE
MIVPWRARGARPYVIAELGVNHDGDVGRALELVDLAAEAGADAVKTQFFRADLLLSDSADLTGAQRDAGEADARSMLRRLELDIAGLGAIAERARARGVDPIVTVFSVELVAEAERIEWAAYKTASPDVVHRPLLEALVGTGKPLIVSTGASELWEVERALTWLRGARERLSALQCVSCYPTAPADAALGGIGALADLVGGAIEVGYSDHTAGVETGADAVASGAQILEKHLTYDTGAAGPDHATSLDAAQLAEYVRLARAGGAAALDVERVKRVLDCEREVRGLCRQSIVAARAIEAGERITREMLTFRRPGDGAAPWRVDEVVGQVAEERIAAGCQVTWVDVERRGAAVELGPRLSACGGHPLPPGAGEEEAR